MSHIIRFIAGIAIVVLAFFRGAAQRMSARLLPPIDDECDIPVYFDLPETDAGNITQRMPIDLVRSLLAECAVGYRVGHGSLAIDEPHLLDPVTALKMRPT